jgi:hypothetical protein
MQKTSKRLKRQINNCMREFEQFENDDIKLRNAIKHKAKNEVEIENKIKSLDKEFHEIVTNSLIIEKKIPT